MNRRMGALLDVLSPKDAACAFARRLRQHVRAHDATTAALGIRAGRKKSPERERGTNRTDPSAEVERESGEKAATTGGEGGELEEHHVEARVVFMAYSQNPWTDPLFSRQFANPSH